MTGFIVFLIFEMVIAVIGTVVYLFPDPDFGDEEDAQYDMRLDFPEGTDFTYCGRPAVIRQYGAHYLDDPVPHVLVDIQTWDGGIQTLWFAPRDLAALRAALEASHDRL